MIPEEQDPLEALLRGLPLRPPPARLDQRLAQTWDEASPQATDRPARRRKRLAVRLAAALLVVAAGLMLAVLIRPTARRANVPTVPHERGAIARSSPRPTPPVAVRPRGPSTRIEQVWCVVTGTQVVTPDKGPPMLDQHCDVTREVHYVDDGGRVRMDWTIPGEETIAIPLDYN